MNYSIIVMVASIVLECWNDDPRRVDTIINGAIQTLGGLRLSDNLIERLKERRFSLEQKPSEPKEVYSINETCICTPGNLASITAHIKTASGGEEVDENRELRKGGSFSKKNRRSETCRLRLSSNSEL